MNAIPPEPPFPLHITRPQIPFPTYIREQMAEDIDTVFTAQLIMKRTDGTSILDIPSPVLAASPSRTSGDLPQERIAVIRKLLEQAGFTIHSANPNTLSISGTTKEFIHAFGLDPSSASVPTGREALQIRADLKPYVADVFIPPPPKYFP